MSSAFWILGFWQGLSLGLLLFLCSAGFTLVYSLMGILNFAHAGFFMLGAYLAFSLQSWLGFWWALALAPLCVALLGAMFEWLMLRRVHAQGHMTEMLLTFGLFLVLVETVQFIWGKAPLALQFPSDLNLGVMGAALPLSGPRLLLLLVASVVLVCLVALMRFSVWGLLIRAALCQPEALRSLGYRLDLLLMSVFALGSGVAALAGVFAGALWSTEPALAWTLGPLLFVIVALGGLGSLRGSFAVALAIGFMQSYAALAGGAWSAWAAMLPYFALLLILSLRPRGLDGQRT